MTGFRVIAGGKAPGDAIAATGEPRRDGQPSLHDLYSRYGASVYGRCAYILKDKSKAEDAMQDVFAKALENLGGFRSEASPLTWLMKIATHHCLNVLRGERAGWRKRFAREEIDRADHLASRGGPHAFEARELVRKVLGRLDEETQMAAIHYHVDEMTLEEVATLLDRSVPTIRKRLAEVSRACERELEKGVRP